MEINISIKTTSSGRVSVTTERRENGVRTMRSYNLKRNDDAIDLDNGWASMTHAQVVRLVANRLLWIKLY